MRSCTHGGRAGCGTLEPGLSPHQASAPRNQACGRVARALSANPPRPAQPPRPSPAPPGTCGAAGWELPAALERPELCPLAGLGPAAGREPQGKSRTPSDRVQSWLRRGQGDLSPPSSIHRSIFCSLLCFLLPSLHLQTYVLLFLLLGPSATLLPALCPHPPLCFLLPLHLQSS